MKDKMLTFLAFLFSGPAVLLIIQCVHWLEDGYWTSYTTLTLLKLANIEPPQIDWVGVRKIVYIFLEMELFVATGMLAFVVLFLALIIEND